LGFIPGKVDHLSTFGCNLRIPHVGWNSINIIDKSILFEGLNNNTDFYFVHSYAFSAIYDEHIIATTEYGVSFPTVIRKDRVWGTQFHPEKSSKAGFILLKNFVKFASC
jgi:glutamine amidotransferase